MRLRVVVLGIPGVGKSTLVEKLAASLQKSKVVTFGTVMLEEGVRRKWVKDRDQLRKLPVEKQRQLQKLTATSISRMRDQAVIVDTHLFIRTKEGFWPGIPFEVARALKPTHLVLVEASPGEIASRRASDRTRYRDAATESSLQQELALARSFLTVCSTLTGAPMMMVPNADGKSSEAAESVAEVLREASS